MLCVVTCCECVVVSFCHCAALVVPVSRDRSIHRSAGHTLICSSAPRCHGADLCRGLAQSNVEDSFLGLSHDPLFLPLNTPIHAQNALAIAENVSFDSLQFFDDFSLRHH